MRKFNHFVFDIPVADCIMMVDAVVDDRADKLRNGKGFPADRKIPDPAGRAFIGRLVEDVAREGENLVKAAALNG